ncbi:MAG TPA: DUF4349 domain-containing protein [Ferruginibacter sp.]|jgi:hypothetical protein|nr:DUF4349 domain-containing protein [Ferruginibacter sp.]
MKLTITAFIAAAILMSSCGRGSSPYTATTESVEDSTNISSSPDSQTIVDPNTIDTRVPNMLYGNSIQRKLTKTVNYDFKVSAVEKTAYEIDKIVKQMNGYTTNAVLKNEITNTQQFPYSKDSLCEVSTYNTTNVITIFVPAEELDSMMQLIQQKIGFLHTRDIAVEDVSLKILGNEMDINAQNKYTEKMQAHTDNEPHKLNQVDAVQKNILENDIQGNATVIDNIKLNDQVKYSQVNITLSQDPSIVKSIVPNTNIASMHTPSFISRMSAAFENGWDFCIDAIVAVTNIWFVFVLIFIVWMMIKKRKILFGFLIK